MEGHLLGPGDYPKKKSTGVGAQETLPSAFSGLE